MVSQNDPRQICVKCGGERPWQSSRQRGVRSWDDYNMCLRCAKVALPEEFKAPLDWLRDDCTCPGCGLVHKNPYQKHKLKNSQDINELKARIEELELSLIHI